MKRRIEDIYYDALCNTLPYGVCYDKKKGVVVFNRNYEALFFKPIGDVKLLDFNPDDLGFKKLENNYCIATNGEEMNGFFYYLHDGYPESKVELMKYLVNVNKLLSCFIDHTDREEFFSGEYQKRRKK